MPKLPCLLASMSVAAGLLPAVPAMAADLIDDTPRLAVISAFPPELAVLSAAAADAETHSVHGVAFTTGMLEGRPVVLFLSGVSMVNAAMTTQLALDHFAVEGIVFSGIAGGVDPALHIGDVVVAGQWGQYLEVVMARETADGWATPPFFEYTFANYGMIHPRAVDVVRSAGAETRFWFEADPAMLAAAAAIAPQVDLADCTADNVCLSHDPRIVVGGNGVSGGAFVDNADFRAYVFDTFSASVLDMESAAVAHVAFANDVPFVAIRSLSDLAGGGEGANEMGTFFQLAADNSATAVRALIAALPQ
ncbi:MAG: 5'-methylthioadenosine/S-adenosylhomocysteine nucleosidase [Alphaproteobacteria bacterium]